jgi:hypothetical protein
MLIDFNSFQFYYNNDLYQKFRVRDSDTWKILYFKPQRKIESFIEECIFAANKFLDLGNVSLMFSGGIDSELMVRTFKMTKRPFDVVIGDYHGKNKHDYEYALACCEELKIKPNIIQIDIEKFWSDDLYEYAKLSQTFSPQLCTYMKLASNITNSICVFGGGENHLIKKTGEWFLSEKERISSLHRFFLKSNISGHGGFFQSTPEIIISAMQDRYLKKYLSDDFVDSKDFKSLWYNDILDISFRPKYTGFENFQDLDYVHRSELKKNPLYGDDIIYTPISNFIQEV